jgi:hypothetical protein
VLSQFKNEIDTLTFFENVCRVILIGGITIKLSLLNDGLPRDFIRHLGLTEDAKLINESEYDKYVFDRDELYAALDVVLVVAESKKTPVNFETVGFETGTGLMVWKVSCKSNDGCFVEEKFKCSQQCSMNEANFSISGQDLVNFLKVSDETIEMYHREDKPLVVSDSLENNVTLLIKVFGVSEPK